LLLSDIPPFVKDPGYSREFNITDKRIIEAVEDDCYVFIDKKIEENTDIYEMFFVIVILINKLINDVYSVFKVLKDQKACIGFLLIFFNAIKLKKGFELHVVSDEDPYSMNSRFVYRNCCDIWSEFLTFLFIYVICFVEVEISFKMGLFMEIMYGKKMTSLPLKLVLITKHYMFLLKILYSLFLFAIFLFL
jgi:hypothetical protein